MRRSCVTSVFALALALAPVALFAQTAPPAQQPPAQQPPATAPAATAQPAAPKLTFASPAGILLVQIKPDQTAVFEEMAGKLKAGLAKTEDATLKQQAAGFKVYKAAEPFGANALYVISGIILVAAVGSVVAPSLDGAWALVPIVLTLLVMVGRVYVGAHNPLDVTAGAGAGMLLGGVLATFV